jgi:4-carboxymuconolactone decarboxylase
MDSRTAFGAAALATVLLTATALSGSAMQNRATTSMSVRRAEPFTRLAARRIKPPDGPAAGTGALCPDSLNACGKFTAFTSHFVTNYTIPLREKELLILRTAWLSRGNYVWGRHNITGRKAGLTAEEISRITQGPDANGWSNFDALLLRTADELHMSRFVTDATWKSLAQRYSDNQLVEVVLIVGNYTMLSMFQNTMGAQLDPGITGLPD